MQVSKNKNIRLTPVLGVIRSKLPPEVLRDMHEMAKDPLYLRVSIAKYLTELYGVNVSRYDVIYHTNDKQRERTRKSNKENMRKRRKRNKNTKEYDREYYKHGPKFYSMTKIPLNPSKK